MLSVQIQIARPVNLIAYHIAQCNNFDSWPCINLKNSILCWRVTTKKRKKEHEKGRRHVGRHFAVTYSLAHSLIGTRNIRHPFSQKSLYCAEKSWYRVHFIADARQEWIEIAWKCSPLWTEPRYWTAGWPDLHCATCGTPGGKDRNWGLSKKTRDAF